MTDTIAPAPLDTSPAPASHARRRWFLILGTVVLLGLVAWGVRAIFFTGDTEETDDAYVAGDIVSITAREGGTVIGLHADDTEGVSRGQRLIDLDPATADVTMASAEADLARAVRAVRSSFSSLDEGGAEVAQAQARLASAQNDYARRNAAATDGAVSGEEVAHAADAVTLARAALGVARSRLAQSRTGVQGASVSDNPAVLAAIAAVRRAGIAQAHMRIVAPVAGVVARRSVQLGQQVAAGTPLMAVVPLDRLWVDANFRETQLRHVRVGQPVTIKADVYGGGRGLSRPCARARGGQRQRFRLAAPAERVGQLDQDRPARARPHRAGRARACRPSAAHRPLGQRRGECSRSLGHARRPPRRRLAADGSGRRRLGSGRSAHPPHYCRQHRRRRMSGEADGGAAGTAPLKGGALAITALALALGTFMQVLDTTIANVSLPTIAGNLGESADTGTWVITSFAVANGVAVPLTGWLMGRYGVVRTFVTSVILFSIASGLCGIAWNLGSLILFRILQGRRFGRDDSGLASAADRDLSAREARARARHLVDDDADRTGHGAGARRLYLGQLPLGLDLPDQPAGRRGDRLHLLAFPRLARDADAPAADRPASA